MRTNDQKIRLFCILYTNFVSKFGVNTQKSVDTKSSQYYNSVVLNRKEIIMYFTSSIVIISIISVLLVERLEKDGFVL
jgi:hypothetical protein